MESHDAPVPLSRDDCPYMQRVAGFVRKGSQHSEWVEHFVIERTPFRATIHVLSEPTGLLRLILI